MTAIGKRTMLVRKKKPSRLRLIRAWLVASIENALGRWS